MIDPRYCDFHFTRDTCTYCVAFNFVHLWNSPEYYNAEYPFSNDGIQLRYKMFHIYCCPVKTN